MSGQIKTDGQHKADRPDRDTAVSRQQHAVKANSGDEGFSNHVGQDLMGLFRSYRTDSIEQ